MILLAVSLPGYQNVPLYMRQFHAVSGVLGGFEDVMCRRSGMNCGDIIDRHSSYLLQRTECDHL